MGKIIETDQQYGQALQEFERLMDENSGPEEIEPLAAQIEEYELKRWPLGAAAVQECPHCRRMMTPVLNASGDDCCCPLCKKDIQ